VNRTDDDKRSDHGEHRYPETDAKKLIPVPTAAAKAARLRSRLRLQPCVGTDIGDPSVPSLQIQLGRVLLLHARAPYRR
jgi:hypothetical protein